MMPLYCIASCSSVSHIVHNPNAVSRRTLFIDLIVYEQLQSQPSMRRRRNSLEHVVAMCALNTSYEAISIIDYYMLSCYQNYLENTKCSSLCREHMVVSLHCTGRPT